MGSCLAEETLSATEKAAVRQAETGTVTAEVAEATLLPLLGRNTQGVLPRHSDSNFQKARALHTAHGQSMRLLKMEMPVEREKQTEGEQTARSWKDTVSRHELHR